MPHHFHNLGIPGYKTLEMAEVASGSIAQRRIRSVLVQTGKIPD
jgi:hypothetical protein